MRERQRLALTPQRAARLVAKLLDEGAAIAATQSHSALSVDDMLDLLATAAYDHATLADGRRVHWKVDGPRQDHGMDPSLIPMDSQSGWHMERFNITRKA